jgi:regulator of protease activity HflC (stomatin/prohibitin superfamily)
MIEFLVAAAVTFVACLVGVPIFFGLLRMFGFYAIVEEGTAHVYVLFGNVAGVLTEPGLHILPLKLGVSAFLVRILGRRHLVDLSLGQNYLRSQPVNSEEGAPMGVGIWYEARVNDPIAFLFKNADPHGSLAANVSSSTVRCLSNMPLDSMLENRHRMSHSVREEVSPQSTDWGYRLGSIYVRKVHFRDSGMIHQIEAKVVNRLRQVTSAIKQTGANQVSVIRSSAERTAAVEFAKAQAIRPALLGEALGEIGRDPELTAALFDVLEVQRLLASRAVVTILPAEAGALASLFASRPPS